MVINLPAKFKSASVLFFMGLMSAVASEAQAPSAAFLEYLGQYQTEEGDWNDPFEIDAMDSEGPEFEGLRLESSTNTFSDSFDENSTETVFEMESH
ncbi:MAG: hypothetical protein JKY24_00405 [Pseudomonadales bacterium]|nr:hypothetical protein [Pseudomonadales bacterium]